MGTTITLSADGVAPVTITGDGVYAGCTYERLEGWYGVTNVDLGFARRPNAPGAFNSLQTYPDARGISIEGKYFGSSRADALVMREALSALYNEGRDVTMTVVDDLRTTSRVVKVDTIEFPWTIHPEFDFSIDVKAADPKRYAPETQTSTQSAAPGGGMSYPEVYPVSYGPVGTSGRLTVSNPGNAETVSRFVVTGGGMPDGFGIVNIATGQRLTYTGSVSPGDVIEVNTATRTATINGTAPASRYLAAPEWWTVPPKGSIQVAFVARGTTTGTPTLTAYTAPAFY